MPLNPETLWKYDFHVLFSSKQKHCFHSFWCCWGNSWPPPLTSKHILNQRAACDNPVGDLPHPQDLFPSASLTGDSEKKADYLVQNYCYMRFCPLKDSCEFPTASIMWPRLSLAQEQRQEGNKATPLLATVHSWVFFPDVIRQRGYWKWGMFRE